MARSKTYGTTWWGRNWLASLTQIDYANRIPRGRAYANTGKVFDVNISPEIGQITAKVKGNYHPFYRVTLKFEQVSDDAKEAFMSDLGKNLTILSKLTNRELDPSLLELASAHKIKLFPTSWRDLGMKCNCPDSAVPCKHIAAVIYIVSEVIDSNPFYVFSLRGIDLLRELENRGFNLDEATRVETSSFASLILNSATSIDRICAQAQEFDMSLEPVIINRTVPLDWIPDFGEGSCYDVNSIVDVDDSAKAYNDAQAKDATTTSDTAEKSSEEEATAEEPAKKKRGRKAATSAKQSKVEKVEEVEKAEEATPAKATKATKTTKTTKATKTTAKTKASTKQEAEVAPATQSEDAVAEAPAKKKRGRKAATSAEPVKQEQVEATKTELAATQEAKVTKAKTTRATKATKTTKADNVAEVVETAKPTRKKRTTKA